MIIDKFSVSKHILTIIFYYFSWYIIEEETVDEEEEEEEEELEEEEEDEDDDEEGIDLGALVKVSAVSQMNSAVDALSRELAKLRTGRASAGRKKIWYAVIDYFFCMTIIISFLKILIRDA